MKIIALTERQAHILYNARNNVVASCRVAAKYQETLYDTEQVIFEQVFLSKEKQLSAKAGLSECGKFAFYID